MEGALKIKATSPACPAPTLTRDSFLPCPDSHTRHDPKEITYMHAEGYSGGALKHGPFALIEDGSRWGGKRGTDSPTAYGGTPIILLILDDHNASLMRTAAEEVRARGAHTIVITDNRKLSEGVADDVIVIPSNGPLTGVLAAIPLQMFLTL